MANAVQQSYDQLPVEESTIKDSYHTVVSHASSATHNWVNREKRKEVLRSPLDFDDPWRETRKQLTPAIFHLIAVTGCLGILVQYYRQQF
jgi:hypothetical protein